MRTLSPLETIRTLAVEIGPRPSASAAEGRAADTLAGRLREAGLDVRIEAFGGLRSFSLTYGLIYASFVLAAALAWASPAAGFVLGALGLLAFALENGGREVVSRLLPKLPSRNVVGVKAPAGEVRRRVVLVCHLDSANAALLWHPRLVAGFRRSFLLMAGAMGAVVLLTGALWLAPVSGLPTSVLRGALLASGAYLLGTVLLLVHRQWRMPCVDGANDNASGVAAVLAAAAGIGPLRHTELWVVGTGCEESGLIGMARFCDAHPFDRKRTWFLNADNCGAGRVTITTAEGMLWRCRCDEGLVAAALRAAAAEPALPVDARAFHTMNNDSFVLLRRGYRALSIMAFDERGLLPNWHWPTDTADRIEPETLACAAELIRRTLRAVDSMPV
ncbi:MAG: M28 family peptidase [Armatimonadetes bacterium]|nr:M28 family peptidase [Armatimonadota bacterium]